MSHEKIKHLTNVRKGHKGYVTRIIGTFEECRKRPDLYIGILEDRKKTLNSLSEQIVSSLTAENDIISEIDSHSAYMESVEELICRFQEARVAPVCSTSSLSRPAVSSGVSVRLPKALYSKIWRKCA